MRSLNTVLGSAVLLAIGTLAAPEAHLRSRWGNYGDKWGGSWGGIGKPWYPGQGTPCMSDADAQKVADNFRDSIAAYTDALALSAFTEDFHDYSDSVIELIDGGCPNSPVALGSATFDSRAAFMAGQSKQPPIPFEQLNLWHTCDAVTLRWKSAGPGQEPAQVTGIIVLETVLQSGSWLIQTVFSEFNSGAWLVNLGIFKPSNCTA